MTVFQVLLLLFLLVPLGEIYLLLKVGGVIGALPTVGLVVFTAVLGAFLMRVQGLSTLQRVQRNLDAGELPAAALLEGAVILIAGALLLTPGFITDAVGFACLVPAIRAWTVHRLLSRYAGREGGPASAAGGRIIDAEFTRDDE